METARKISPELKIEAEVENFDELLQTIARKVDCILLNNMDIPAMEKAMRLTHHKTDLEASGSITYENITRIAETGVDYISIGALTKNIQAIDFSIRFIEKDDK